MTVPKSEREKWWQCEIRMCQLHKLPKFMVEFYYAIRITASENNKQPNELFNASKQCYFGGTLIRNGPRLFEMGLGGSLRSKKKASKQSNFTIQIKCFGSQTSSCKKGESSYRLVKCVRFCSSSGIGPTAFKEYILLQWQSEPPSDHAIWIQPSSLFVGHERMKRHSRC
jgi:hypothetical protein